MGEYAVYRGEQVKIGTCEEMYYLRADQARLVRPESGSVSPLRDAEAIRFRFPFPWEDGIEPGAFEDYNKRVSIPGLTAPAELAESHYTVQFTSPIGYNVCIPCPEATGRETARHGLTIHRNGFAGSVFLAQQRFADGQLLPLLSCACGMTWRVTEDESAELFAALEAAAVSERRREEMSHRHWESTELPADWTSMYDDLIVRVRQGYDREHVAGLGFDAAVPR